VHGDPVQGIDPTGNEFSLIGMLTGISISQNGQQQKGAADFSAKKMVKKFVNEVLDNFDFSEPTDTWQKKMARAGEKLWFKRLTTQLGYFAVPIQETVVGSHGPDMIAAKLNGQRLTVVIGEIKALSSSKALAALDETLDNGTQMSLAWLSHYASMLVAPLLQAVAGAAETAIAAVNPAAATFVTKAIEKGKFDLYLLRARRYEGNQWKLRGFRLLHLGETEVGKQQRDLTDPIQRTYPDSGYVHQTT
jgi:transcriptional regulator of acetoin/glycerol metabolism